ncbi:hypothetical protein [Azospirillum doebereinerae]
MLLPLGDEDDADLAQAHGGDQFLKASPPAAARSGQAEILLNDPDLRCRPAEGATAALADLCSIRHHGRRVSWPGEHKS